MKKYIPYEKLSKKEKRKQDLAGRQTWGNLDPVTRKPANSRAYNRKRAQDWKKDLPDLRSYSLSRQKSGKAFYNRVQENFACAPINVHQTFTGNS